MIDKASSPPPQNFHPGFIWAAIASTLLGGLALGIGITYPIGFGENIPNEVKLLIHVHGHLQLVGWAGLFIIGVSLYFFPRFLKTPLPLPAARSWILALILGGLVAGSGSTYLLSRGADSFASLSLITLIRAGAVVEWGGVALYLLLLALLFRKRPAANLNQKQLMPFFGMMAIGWGVFETASILQSWAFDPRQSLPWNPFIVDVFKWFVLFPAAMAFSVRTFPLFIQIPPLRFPVHRLAIGYLLCSLAALLPSLPVGALSASNALSTAAAIAQILRGTLTLWMIVELKVLQKSTMRPERFLLRYFGKDYVEERRGNAQFVTARAGSYDHGEYGRFELLLFGAYYWLLVAVVLEIAESFSGLVGMAVPFGADAPRHAFFLGFITLLIFGMAAAVLRVGPLLTPGGLLESGSPIGNLIWRGFGLSGIALAVGVVLFAVNLVATVRMGRGGNW